MQVNKGLWPVHAVFSCQEVCPEDLNPTGSIAELKFKAIKARFGVKP